MKHIIDPRLLLDGMPPSSPIWTLADAFDAAANGMENPEADARLALIEETEFRPWKAAITAMKALYADDREACLRAAASIQEDSPLVVLVPFFQAWAATTAPNREAAVQERLADADTAIAALYGRVIADAHPLGSLADQAEEALRQGMLDHFERSSARILRELHGNRSVDGPFLALRFAARCLSLLNDEGLGGADFFSIIIRSLGRADGFLSLGLALVGKDDCAAAAAFRGALEAQDGVFLDARMSEIVAEAIEVLENPPVVPQSHKNPARRNVCEDRETIQLELFL